MRKSLAELKLTKQGVRDFGTTPKKKRVEVPPTCEHKRMKECCKGCGHYHCPDCGLEWDHYAGM